MRVDLRGSAENDAVAIDNEHLTTGPDGTENLRRNTSWIVDLVKGNPFADFAAAGSLVELERRVLPDVESIPIQDGLLRGLLDRDRGFATPGRLNRGLGIDPGSASASSAEDPCTQ